MGYGITASCPASAFSGRPSKQSSSVDEEENEPGDRKRRRSLTFGPRAWSTSSKTAMNLNLPGAISGGDGSLERSATSTPSISSQGTTKSTHLTVPVQGEQRVSVPKLP